jgi:hypothetical protein
VNGSSAAAATVAGAAALLAQARPSLDAAALKSLLAESARPLPGTPVAAQGAGLVDPGAAAAAEVAAEPASLALGNATGKDWETRQRLLLRNLSTRDVGIRIRIARQSEGAASVRFSARPAHLVLGRGASAWIDLRVFLASAPRGHAPAAGTIVVLPAAGLPLRLPWEITFERRRPSLLGPVRLSPRSFEPSILTPALLTLRAGTIGSASGRDQLHPLERLDISLWNARGVRLGLLARLRDVLPGTFQFGVTGRSPGGAILDRGRYTLRLVAVPTTKGPATQRWITLRIK